jgi:hypothetical protein
MIDALFTVTLLDLFIGGGGRLVEIGPATLRMVLFALSLCCTLYMGLLGRRQDGQVLALALVALYLMVHIPAFILGTLRGHPLPDMLGEIQPTLYFLAAPFFAMVLSSPAMVRRTASLVVVAGATLAISYLLVLVGLAIGVIDFAPLYTAMSTSGEFFFRGESFFFYKGFLYLGIAIIFLVAVRGKHWRSLLILIAGALILTLTRGFVLSTSVALLLLLAATGRWRSIAYAAIPIGAAAILVFVQLPSLDEGFLDQRDISNSQRLDDVSYIVENATVGTILMGEGFGSLINERLNIENSFLWAFWKLGLIGVAFWTLPLAMSVYYYVRVPKDESSHRLALGFLFGTVLVYVQTQTNPYLNNPIGLSFVLLSVFSLRTLSRQRFVKTRLEPVPARHRPVHRIPAL